MKRFLPVLLAGAFASAASAGWFEAPPAPTLSAEERAAAAKAFAEWQRANGGAPEAVAPAAEAVPAAESPAPPAPAALPPPAAPAPAAPAVAPPPPSAPARKGASFFRRPINPDRKPLPRSGGSPVQW